MKKSREEVAELPVEEPQTQLVEVQAEPESKTVEEWAIILEHFDVPAQGREFLDVAKQKKWLFDTTKVHKQWPKGLVMTREQYEADIASMLSIKLSSN